MLVLIATDETTAPLVTDHYHALDGELVTPVVLDCPDPLCDVCSRAWFGLASNGGATTAMVVERPDVTEPVLRRRLHEWLDRTGEIELVVRASEDGDFEVDGTLVDDPVSAIDGLVTAHVREIQAVCARFPVGTVLSRMGQLVAPRQEADAA